MSKPVRLSPQGPSGWKDAPNVTLETFNLVGGDPTGLDHIYYANPETKVKAGLWRSNAYSEYYEDYPVDEFMVVLDGEVTLEGEGFRDTFRKGDAFFVPKGFKGTWHQPGPLLKFYVIIG